jgi:hypothetical protein
MTIGGWKDGSWDRCMLGTEYLPGIVSVEVTPAWDVQAVASPGKDAPALKDQGNKGAAVKITVEIREDQLADFVRCLTAISPKRPGGIKDPVPIVSPQTAIAGVTHVTSVTYTIGKPNRKTGTLTVPITCHEWFPEEETQRDATQGLPGAPSLGDGGPLGDPTVPEPDPENLGADYP